MGNGTMLWNKPSDIAIFVNFFLKFQPIGNKKDYCD